MGFETGGGIDAGPQKWGGMVAHSQKWGGDPLAAEGRAILHPPPLSMFLAPSLNAVKLLKHILQARKKILSKNQ